MIQWAVKAGNNSKGKSTEIVIFAATNRDQLLLGYLVGSHCILRALGANDSCASLGGDMRNVEHVVVMRVCDEDEIRPLYV